jgi:hypothetical protein
MSKDHNFITGFIERYGTFPCLWKKTDPLSHNTVKRENAYKILLEKCNEYGTIATKQSVLRKIKSLLCAYKEEYKKLKNRSAVVLELMMSTVQSRFKVQFF